MADKFNQLLLHPKTRLQINHLLSNPPHALLIVANAGSGKKTLATAFAAELLELQSTAALVSYPYFFHVTRLKNKSDISIEQVREVISAQRLKTPGSNKIRRAVFIEDAHNLSIPAQNALLKILEEPSQDTIFILSSTSEKGVLPTIASRLQKVEILPVGQDSAMKFWESKGFNKQDVVSAWRLSGGSVGLLSALLSESKDHPLKQAVDDTKFFIKSNKYERLLFAEKLSRSKENFALFLDAMSRTLNYLNHSAIKNGKHAQASHILASRRVLKESSDALNANANAKLVATRLVLGLKI
jgi:replication-associated recombination protein RarA